MYSGLERTLQRISMQDNTFRRPQTSFKFFEIVAFQRFFGELISGKVCGCGFESFDKNL
jgi:CRISPR/Cas system CSM-associated protein Csm2 small subunit